MKQGVLTDKDIKELIDNKNIILDIDESKIQPNTLDLTCGSEAYKLRSSFVLRKNETIKDVLSELKAYKFNLSRKEGGVLEKGITYLIELKEHLKLPSDIRAYSSPKSSIGRLDVLVTLTGHKNTSLDEIPEGYEGKLYIQVTPQSFPIRIREGDDIIQMRFVSGDSSLNRDNMNDLNFKQSSNKRFLLYDSNGNGIINPKFYDGGLILSAELSEGSIIYVSKDNTLEIDLSRRDYKAKDFFEDSIIKESRSIIINPGQFAIISTKEFVSIPPQDVCAEMIAINLSYGSFRAHYAGFFDSGFGYRYKLPSIKEGEFNLEGFMGNQATLEVRAFDRAIRFTDGQEICKLAFFHNLSEVERPYGIGRDSNYQFQKGAKLPKYFKT